MSRRRVINNKRKIVQVIEEITSSTTWPVPEGCTEVDVFLVGGGAGGAYNAGGGGYTKTVYRLSVTPGQIISCVIGKGGSYGGMNGDATAGGTTSFGAIQVAGGATVKNDLIKGGDGGSGGAGYTHATGGSDGSNGQDGTADRCCKGGLGQGTSTRCPFNNKLYSKGGDTGRNIVNPDGNWGEDENTKYKHGEPNTGNGGSGSGWYGGNGGSGIIILRYNKYA